MDSLEKRKKEHIELAFSSQTAIPDLDKRFHYEPLLQPHPVDGLKPVRFLGKSLKAPLWVSSMTGGTRLAGTINRNLARACREFGLGMGLGSCRILMDSDEYLSDFDVRDIIGDDLPLWANLGIAQVEELVNSHRVGRASELVDRLRADGLIVHVNPMQEWMQPEGDLLGRPPIETLHMLLDEFQDPVIVKEVGQGMGPESLKEILNMPLKAIEFGAFGGTNFARVELMRDERPNRSLLEPLSRVGEDAFSMLESVNNLAAEMKVKCRELIISGGIRSFLDGYYLVRKSKLNAVYGMASTFLRYAREDYSQLKGYVETQIRGLEMAYAYLTIKE